MALVWLLRAVVVAAIQPRRDSRASERLQALRDRSHAPGHTLLAIQYVAWTGAAGQRVHALDITHGTVHDLWLSEVALPVGSFAVLDLSTDPIRVVDWLDRRPIVEARRHDLRAAIRQRVRDDRATRVSARRVDKAVVDLVREAERLFGHE